MSRDDLITSAFGRFIKVVGLVGRVGVSIIGEQAASLLRDGPTAQLKKAENAVRNAIRIADTLGEMKGAAMKVGQMLSLHEGLLPPEVSAVLSVLQKQAPSVSFDVMEGELRRELGNFDELFESLEPDAFAAASIGQVHRGVLRDGREVAVKILPATLKATRDPTLARIRRSRVAAAIVFPPLVGGERLGCYG